MSTDGAGKSPEGAGAWNGSTGSGSSALVHVKITAGTGAAKTTFEAYIPADKAKFQVPGPEFFQLREGGVTLPTPEILRRGRVAAC